MYPRERRAWDGVKPDKLGGALLQEFKKFAMRGNVMDMAVGIIIGAAFSKIVSSAVKDVIMPPIGVLLGGVDFEKLVIPVKYAVPAVLGENNKIVTEAAPEVAIRYGAFINTVVDFVIVAFVIFMVVRAMNSMKKEEPKAAATQKKCDFCVSKIDISATRCPHCTSELSAA